MKCKVPTTNHSGCEPGYPCVTDPVGVDNRIFGPFTKAHRDMVVDEFCGRETTGDSDICDVCLNRKRSQG